MPEKEHHTEVGAAAILKEMKLLTRIGKYLLLKNFLEGIFYGLGATIGLAIVITILSFIARFLGGVPVVGNWFIHFGKFLHQ